MDLMDKEEIYNSLIKFDKYCEEANLAVELIIIGGSACILKYGIERKTYDIDVLSTAYASIKGLKLETFGLSIVPIGILNLPEDYESRLRAVKGFRRIKVFTLGPIDLILTKLGRGGPRDLQDCKEIITYEKLNREALISVYNDWKLDYVGNLDRLDIAFNSILE